MFKFRIWDRRGAINGVRAADVIKAHHIKDGAVGTIEDETGKTLVLLYDNENPKTTADLTAELERMCDDMNAKNNEAKYVAKFGEAINTNDNAAKAVNDSNDANKPQTPTTPPNTPVTPNTPNTPVTPNTGDSANDHANLDAATKIYTPNVGTKTPSGDKARTIAKNK